MKVFTRIVLDMETLKCLESESFEHTGEIALCCSTQNNPPPKAPEIPDAPQLVSRQMRTARKNQKQDLLLTKGRNATILSSNLNDSANLNTNTLLGR